MDNIFSQLNEIFGKKSGLFTKQQNDAVFKLVTEFKGYRAKEDLTALPAGYLVPGAQNVLTTTSGTIKSRQGYTLDGASNDSGNPVRSSFDWITHLGYERNLRSGDGVLQFRYVAEGGEIYDGTTLAEGDVVWVDILSSLTDEQEYFNFCTFWNTTELKQELLFVNGQSLIYEWSGAVAPISGYTTNTISIASGTWGELGFLTAGTRQITIDGIDYTYTGGEGTATLTGVTPDPTIDAPAVGTLAVQKVRSTANSAMTTIPATFANSLISNLKNQIYVGSLVSNTFYVSHTNSFTNYSNSATRVPGEGATITLDDVPKAFIPQEDTMYVSAGHDFWYRIAFTLSADLSAEDLTVFPLNVGPQQAAQSQAMCAKAKSSVVFITFEPSFDDLARVSSNAITPDQQELSDPIRNDFESYNYTNASVIYFSSFFYLALPAEGIVLIYNIDKEWWEAPQLLPVSRFSIIDGELYGHSSQTFETYKLFNGYNDNGNPINARASFAYNQFGDRSWQKNFNEFYVEGYISSNTTLSVGLKYDFGGFRGIGEYEINGSDTTGLYQTFTDNSFGKNPLGDQPIGSVTDSPSDLPKFRRVIPCTKLDFYEYQPFFETNEVDYQWELLAFGPLVMKSPQQNNAIKKGTTN